MITRRGFLGACAAFAACGDDIAPPLELCVQSWCFRAFPMAEALAMTSALGLSRIELAYIHLGDLAETRAALDAANLTCLTFAPGLSRETFTEQTARIAFENARGLGAGAMMIDLPAELLDPVEALAVEYDIRVGIHNHTGSTYTFPQQILDVLEGRDRRIGSIVDTGHYLRMGVDPAAAIHAFAGRLVGLHLKDAMAANVDAPDAALGEGILDVDAVACALRDVRVPSYAALSLEYEGEPDAPSDALSRAITRFARSARYCK